MGPVFSEVVKWRGEKGDMLTQDVADELGISDQERVYVWSLRNKIQACVKTIGG